MGRSSRELPCFMFRNINQISRKPFDTVHSAVLTLTVRARLHRAQYRMVCPAPQKRARCGSQVPIICTGASTTRPFAKIQKIFSRPWSMFHVATRLIPQVRSCTLVRNCSFFMLFEVNSSKDRSSAPAGRRNTSDRKMKNPLTVTCICMTPTQPNSNNVLV
jgi:hypothetical protein